MNAANHDILVALNVVLKGRVGPFAPIIHTASRGHLIQNVLPVS